MPSLIPFKINKLSAKYKPKLGLLSSYVDKFNAIPEDDHIRRIFYLQKINFLLNQCNFEKELFEKKTFF